ncbi:superoxide dismutase [Candidatus Eisenbacteria bacterium]|uniref:Superoxide dismutase n=1 Tax=Eiseniibacteriota bacterium TaxID=2212470 RepID=A0ABV6YLL8_UNCEI
MPFESSPLPFGRHALAPHLSAESVALHYVKHYKGHVRALNRLTEGKPESELSLEEIVLLSRPGPVLNNAAQAWNHAFFWNSLTPAGGGAPHGDLAAAIGRDFGSFDAFKERFSRAAILLFGSGWTWLVLSNGKLKIRQTRNADTPMKHGDVSLLTLDVWEHAYYTDYHHARAKYVAAFIDNLVNWGFAAANLAKGATKEFAVAEESHQMGLSRNSP